MCMITSGFARSIEAATRAIGHFEADEHACVGSPFLSRQPVSPSSATRLIVAGSAAGIVVAPTDGEAQLLLATLLRRVGRRAESRTALEKLSRSDAGRPWLGVIRRELSRLESTLPAPTAEGEGGAEAVVLRLPSDGSSGNTAPRRAA